MEENFSSGNIEANTNELEQIPLLPRSAWNSQLGYLKALFKAKQALDKRQKQV